MLHLTYKEIRNYTKEELKVVAINHDSESSMSQGIQKEINNTYGGSMM